MTGAVPHPWTHPWTGPSRSPKAATRCWAALICSLGAPPHPPSPLPPHYLSSSTAWHTFPGSERPSGAPTGPTPPQAAARPHACLPPRGEARGPQAPAAPRCAHPTDTQPTHPFLRALKGPLLLCPHLRASARAVPLPRPGTRAPRGRPFLGLSPPPISRSPPETPCSSSLFLLIT